MESPICVAEFMLLLSKAHDDFVVYGENPELDAMVARLEGEMEKMLKLVILEQNSPDKRNFYGFSDSLGDMGRAMNDFWHIRYREKFLKELVL